MPPQPNLTQEITFRIDERGCWICTSHRRREYGHVEINMGGRTTILHRYVYQRTRELERLESDQVVRHTCDNPACINPFHLEIGTHADNVRDRVQRGRSARGTRSGRAKLTESQVLEIRASVEGAGPLARRYGVDDALIRAIRKGKIWRHLLPADDHAEAA